MRALPDVPSAKVIVAVGKWSAELSANGDRLYVAGVSPATATVFRRGGLTDALGSDGIVVATDTLFAAVDEAVDRGRAWIASGPQREPRADRE
jgi:SulP family sulfate permease